MVCAKHKPLVPTFTLHTNPVLSNSIGTTFVDWLAERLQHQSFTTLAGIFMSTTEDLE